MCGDSIILSEEGVQQGYPLGPLLFCLTLHPLLSQLQSELKIFYLDDRTVGGSTESVLQDLNYLESGAAELGLQLNQSKSELICDDMFFRKVMLDEAPSLGYVSCSQATLLGSPIGGQECIDHTIAEKVDMLERMGSRLHAVSSHDALLLLWHSFTIPKVLYVLRTAPCFISPVLARFYEPLCHLLCVILNVPLNDDSAWLQDSLPVRSGGIGIRRSVQLAPSAYLASAACCSELIPQILPPHLHTSSDPHVEEALTLCGKPPMIILLHLIHLHTVNVSGILPSSKHLSMLLWSLHPTLNLELAFWPCLVQSLEPGFMLCQYLQLAFRWTMMSSESQLVFVLVSQCAIPMCALAVVLRSIISGLMA